MIYDASEIDINWGLLSSIYKILPKIKPKVLKVKIAPIKSPIKNINKE